MMPTKQSLELSSRYATKAGRRVLAEKINTVLRNYEEVQLSAVYMSSVDVLIVKLSVAVISSFKKVGGVSSTLAVCFIFYYHV